MCYPWCWAAPPGWPNFFLPARKLTTGRFNSDGPPTRTTAKGLQYLSRLRRTSRAELEAVLERFRGPISQTPPPFSAKKVAGTPAYRLARKHIAVELEPVEVRVLALDLGEFDGTTARICVRCSAGTYLRGIAHDVGQQLGCGAFLTALRRTLSAEFTESQARTLEALEELARSSALHQALIPAVRVLPEIPNATVDALTAGQIRQGKDFRLSPFVDRAGAKYVKAVSPEGDLIAIGEVRLPNLYHPVLVM